MNPLNFTIIVPFLNAGRFIERCARGLLSQTYPADRYEVLMVDNNSTDQSAAIVKGFDRIRLLNEPQLGAYAARNRGIQEALGEIVAFTDPDCVPRADWLEQIARSMADPKTGVILGDRRFATDFGILGVLAVYESALIARIFAESQVDCYYAYTNNMAVRKSVLQMLGGFPTVPRGADSLFMRRAVAQYGSSVVRYAPQVFVRHLEIAGIRDYLDKKSIYGQVNRNRELATARALPFGTRLKLALRAGQEAGSSPAEAIGFLGVLAAGAIRFEWRRLRIGGW